MNLLLFIFSIFVFINIIKAETCTKQPPQGYSFCTTRLNYNDCYNLCGPPGYWFIKPCCCCK